MGLKNRIVRRYSLESSAQGDDTSTEASLPSAGRHLRRGVATRILSSLRHERLSSKSSTHPHSANTASESQDISEGNNEIRERTSLRSALRLSRDRRPSADNDARPERNWDQNDYDARPARDPGVLATGGGCAVVANAGQAMESSQGQYMWTRNEPSSVPQYQRNAHPVPPDLSDRYVMHPSGVAVRDDHVAFTVPREWTAVRIDDGFLLQAGQCIGFITACKSTDASAKLCDTSLVAVMGQVEAFSSPVFDQNSSILVVEYCGQGTGRG